MPSGPESAPAPGAWPHADSPATTPSPDPGTLPGEFIGRRGPLFWLAFRTGVLTVLTLGLYRFWQKTRLRRWYWSAIRIGGHPLEYVGDPIEKLLGFLIAVVILAFYIGVVNLFLMFASFSLFQGNTIAYALSFVGVLPLWFYAQYRARRYVLARTRWRGLRLGLEPGAWGYAGRALWHWALTIVSAGILWPRMTFALEKYKTDRTSYGTAHMVQGGRWTMLYASARWILIALPLIAISAFAYWRGLPALGTGVAILAAGAGLYGLVYYRVDSLKRLTETKSLGGVALRLDPNPARIVTIYLIGYLLAGIAVTFPATALGFLILALQSEQMLAQMGIGDVTPFDGLNRGLLIALTAMAYFAIFLIWSALTHALVTMPTIRHYTQNLTLTGRDGLGAIRQRPRDEHQEAEGFAEALDVGASI